MAENVQERGNHLLNRLSAEQWAAIEPDLQRISLARLETMLRQHQRIEAAYFPITCVASLVKVMRGGEIIEAATIGNEGMVGLPAVIGAGSAIGQVAAQIPGEAYRMDAQALRRVEAENAAFRDTLQRYTQAFLLQITQSVACNQLHSIRQRLCRWLLMMRDRSRSAELRITQEFLAEMLGVRRATVAGIVGELQRAGMLALRRGAILIRDDKALEACACECYATVRDEYEALLGAPFRELGPG